MIAQFVGEWHAANDTFEVPQPLPWERRTNLGGVTLVNCVRFFGPMVIELKDSDGNLVGSSGLFPSIVQTLGSHLNFTMTTMNSRDNSWGTAHPNGSASGIIRELAEGVADITACPITRLLSRSRVIDYSVGIMAERGSINMRKSR